MKLHHDLGVTQKTAWYMQQRTREAFATGPQARFQGPVETDETYVGGLERDKPVHKKLNAGRSKVGKTAVAGIRDRATGQVSVVVVPNTTGRTIRGFVFSAKHAQRFVNECAGHNNIRDRDTFAKLAFVSRHMVGRHLPYSDLIVGASSGQP